MRSSSAADNRTALNRANQAADPDYYSTAANAAAGSGYLGGEAFARDFASRRVAAKQQAFDNLLDGVVESARPDAVYAAHSGDLNGMDAQSDAWVEANGPGKVGRRTFGNPGAFSDGRDARDIRQSFAYKSRLSAELAQLDARAAAERQWANAPRQYIGPVNVEAQRAADLQRESLRNFLNGQGSMALGGVAAAGVMLRTGDVVAASIATDVMAPLDSFLAPRGPGAATRLGSGQRRGPSGGVNEAHNAASFARYRDTLQVTEAANPLVDSLLGTGALPSNFVTKQQAVQAGWKPGKALGNFVPGGQIGGDVFQNTTSLVPSAPGRIWYEADVGLASTMSRSNQPGTRLLYSNDGQLYVTTDHYKTSHPIGKWKP